MLAKIVRRNVLYKFLVIEPKNFKKKRKHIQVPPFGAEMCSDIGKANSTLEKKCKL